MKKNTTKPDGTVEIIEGSAEELAEFEQKLSEDKNKDKNRNKKKSVLLG